MSICDYCKKEVTLEDILHDNYAPIGNKCYHLNCEENLKVCDKCNELIENDDFICIEDFLYHTNCRKKDEFCWVCQEFIYDKNDSKFFATEFGEWHNIHSICLPYIYKEYAVCKCEKGLLMKCKGCNCQVSPRCYDCYDDDSMYFSELKGYYCLKCD